MGGFDHHFWTPGLHSVLAPSIKSMSGPELLELLARLRSNPSITRLPVPERHLKALIGLEGEVQVPPCPSAAEAPYKSKLVVVSDSSFILSKSKGTSSPQSQIIWDGSSNATVRAIGGAQAPQLLDEINRVPDCGNTFVLLSWMFNDFFDKQCKQKIDQNVIDTAVAKAELMCRELKRFRGATAMIGAAGYLWGGDALYDSACDQVRTVFSRNNIPWTTGTDFFGNLTMKGGAGGWHAQATDENKTRFSYQVRKLQRFMELTYPHKVSIEAYFRSDFARGRQSQTPAVILPIDAPDNEAALRNDAEVLTIPADTSISSTRNGEVQTLPQAASSAATAALLSNQATEFAGPTADSAAPVRGGFMPDLDRWGRPNIGILQQHQALSKEMSNVLRHKADRYPGLAIRRDGFCIFSNFCDVIRRRMRTFVTEEDIATVVRHSDKKRFQLWEADRRITHIRATQGHSVAKICEEDLFGYPIGPRNPRFPDTLAHGMKLTFVNSIISSSLKPGGPSTSRQDRAGGNSRRHNHFAPFPYNDPRIVAGARFDAECTIYFDWRQILADGNIRLFWSDSDAILSPDEIPGAYVTYAQNNYTGQIIYRKTETNSSSANVGGSSSSTAAIAVDLSESEDDRIPAASDLPSEVVQAEGDSRRKRRWEEDEMSDEDDARTIRYDEPASAGIAVVNQCEKCGYPFAAGSLVCTQCTTTIAVDPQPPNEAETRRAATLAEEGRTKVYRLLGIEIKTSGTIRGPYRSTLGATKKQARKLHFGAIKDGFAGGYRERFFRDDVFGARMTENNRDADWADQFWDLELESKPKETWQAEALLLNARNAGFATGFGSKGKGRGTNVAGNQGKGKDAQTMKGLHAERAKGRGKFNATQVAAAAAALFPTGARATDTDSAEDVPWKWIFAAAVMTAAILLPIFLWMLSRTGTVERVIVHVRPNSAAQSSRARSRWQRAFRSITWVLKLRRRWAAIGVFLNHPNILSLSQGLTRQHGILHRTASADAAVRTKAKAAAKKAFSRAAARYGNNGGQ